MRYRRGEKPDDRSLDERVAEAKEDALESEIKKRRADLRDAFDRLDALIGEVKHGS